MRKEKFNVEDKAVIVKVYVEADGITNELDMIVDTGTHNRFQTSRNKS